jgi:hypothetical protein
LAGGGWLVGQHVEEAVLAGGAIAGLGGGLRESGIDAVEERLAGGTAEVEGAGLYQMLEEYIMAKLEAKRDSTMRFRIGPTSGIVIL